MLSDKLNIFDFIAFLLKELGSEADRRYSGLQTLSYVPAPDYIAFVNHFIADIEIITPAKIKIISTISLLKTFQKDFSIIIWRILLSERTKMLYLNWQKPYAESFSIKRT